MTELENSEENSGHTLHGEIYDNNLYLSMRAFWDLFTGEITHEYTCTSCKNAFQNQEPINYLLLKFPDVHHECDQYCTVEFLIQYHLQEKNIDNYWCSFWDKNTSATKKSAITKYPSFMCILLCCSRRDNNGTISSAVQFPALDFDIKGDNMPYDLSATVHQTPRRSGSHQQVHIDSVDVEVTEDPPHTSRRHTHVALRVSREEGSLTDSKNYDDLTRDSYNRCCCTPPM